MNDTTPRATEARPARLYYLDWLRVLAMLAIFSFHSDRPFNFDNWHVKNAATNLASSLHVSFFDQWMMPLFFIVSGAAVYYSLKSRRPGGFAWERVLRIAVPWLILGIFVMAPPQVYLERLTHGDFSGSFLQFYATRYFDGVYAFGGNLAVIPLHLWYLVLLFFFSMIALPLFVTRRKTGRSLITGLAGSFGKPWALLLLFLPLAVASIVASGAGLGFTRQMGSWDVLTYLLFFIYGYLIFSSEAVQEVVRRCRRGTLVTAVVLTAGLLYVQYGVEVAWNSPLDATYLTARSLLAWCWIIAILGYGSRFLNFNNRFLSYASEAVLPFYILHQTVIVIVASFVVRWSLGIPVKYVIVLIISFIVIMAIYELLVRRINLLRFLFGMRPKKRQAPA